MVPVVHGACDSDPRGQKGRQKAQRELGHLAAAAQHGLAAVLAVETRAAQ